ncbi:MAG: stage II sporulation protein P [Clostridia bacterium]|nr:stage II sporulation protein P [Clostridia bacterium]
MRKIYWALLCSVAAAIGLGIILSYGRIVPASALSYAVGPTSVSMPTKLLSHSLPSLPPLPQGTQGPTAETGGEEDSLSAPLFSAADYTVKIPNAPEKAEAIVEKTYASSLSVNNNSPKDIDINTLLEHVPNLDFSGKGPQILIVHTHTSEAYNETGQNWYADTDTRSTDNSKNMVHMGEILETELTARGYSVIHCQKRHDEDFNHSYTRSNETVREYLERYPSIAVVIDLHRDSLIDGEGTKYRPTVEADGGTAAQIMLLMGVGNDIYPHPDWKENLSLAARIQQQGELLFPGLMRPILVRPSRYNQHLCTGAILVELGACGNTPAEAEQSARLFGEICAKALDQIREDQS